MNTQPTPFTFNDDRSGELASPIWIKSSLSYAHSGCVEVAASTGDLIRVRDSKNPAGSILRFSSSNWNAFVGDIQHSRFDNGRQGRDVAA
jgi:hypothetical protein